VKLVGSCMVATLDLRPGVRVAAAWSGGPYVAIHAVHGGGFGLVVETLDAWDHWLDRPKIEPTLAALEKFVLEALQEADIDGVVSDLVEDVIDWGERRSGELVTASAN